jgi:hypothetical protein
MAILVLSVLGRWLWVATSKLTNANYIKICIVNVWKIKIKNIVFNAKVAYFMYLISASEALISMTH